MSSPGLDALIEAQRLDADGRRRSAETNQRIALFDKYMVALLQGGLDGTPETHASFVAALVEERFAFAAKMGEPRK